MLTTVAPAPVSDSTDLLPAAYAELTPYLQWALETEVERHMKRLSSTMDETRILYDAMAPHMEGILQYLQGFPIGQKLNEADHRLFLLALSFIEVALPIELNWQATRNDGSYPTTRLERPHRP